MKNYIQKIREKIGHQKIIYPAARIILENNLGQILFIKRKDNGNLGIIAGAFEENETIEGCIIREVKEEVGLDILSLNLIGLSSNPKKETVEYSNGDLIQYFTCEFYSNNFSGEIKCCDEEVKSAGFMSSEKYMELPTNERSTFESLKYFKKNGKVRLT